MKPIRERNNTRVIGGTKILIAAGGSGGHIFPAVALARAIKSARPEARIKFVISSKDLDRRILEKEGFDFATVSSNSFPYKLSARIIIFFFKLLIDLVRSLFINALYRPDVITGFGGYVPCPVILTAKMFRIPVMVHEQNVVPGRANRLVFGMADKIALSFEETLSIIGGLRAKSVVTGNPIRTEDFLAASMGPREAISKKLGLDSAKFTILVIGGSQGAHVLNDTFIKALEKMEEPLRSSMQVIHITGVKDYERASTAYRQMGIAGRVYSFIDNIDQAYGASDIAITRAGASAIFELAFFAKPMILVPYPFAMSHQRENANVFSKKGAAITIEESELSPALFTESIKSLFEDRPRRSGLSESARRSSVPGASMELARRVMELAGYEYAE